MSNSNQVGTLDKLSQELRSAALGRTHDGLAMKTNKCRSITRLFAILLVAIAVLVFPGPKNADGRSPSDGRQQVWSTRIDRLVQEPPGWMAISHHQTEAIAISPDAKWLAITLAHVHDSKHVLIIDVLSPESNVRQFDLPVSCGVDLAWNQGGNALLVCGTLLRLTNGATCLVNGAPFPRVSRNFKVFWWDAEHVILPSGEIHDLACKEVGSWQMGAGWRIGAVAISKGWVLLARMEGQVPNMVCILMIVDRASQNPVSGWPPQKSRCSANTMFAPGAEAVCFNLFEGGNRRLHCWPVNGGKEIALPRQVRGYNLNQAAASSAEIVVDKLEYGRFDGWLVLGPSAPGALGRAVLDLRSGKVISSWKRSLQGSTTPRDWQHPCALSSGGEYLAESGDDTLELYRLAQ